MDEDDERTPRAKVAELDGQAPDRAFDAPLHRVFTAERRRRLVHLLRTGRDETTLEELATQLAGWSATEGGRMASAEDRDRILAQLHHCDLPILEELGLVAFDPPTGMVSVRSIPDSLAEAVAESVRGTSAEDR